MNILIFSNLMVKNCLCNLNRKDRVKILVNINEPDFYEMEDNDVKVDDSSVSVSLSESEETIEEKTINVDIKGGVLNPGVYKLAEGSIVQDVINESGGILDGISYWSLTDGIDCNLERIRSNYLSDGIITDINQIPTACGGLFPTHKE